MELQDQVKSESRMYSNPCPTPPGLIDTLTLASLRPSLVFCISCFFFFFVISLGPLVGLHYAIADPWLIGKIL